MLLPIVNTASARDVQRNYRKIAEKVKKSNEPVVVIRNNQPEVAIVSLDMLTEYKVLKADSGSFDFSIFEKIWNKNKDLDPDEVYKDVTEEVEKVRQERYEQQQKAAGSR